MSSSDKIEYFNENLIEESEFNELNNKDIIE